jgi:pilus assembly protein FimV
MGFISAHVHALSLGNLNIQSKTTEPLIAEVGIQLSADEASGLKDLSVALSSPDIYKRLGITSSATQTQLKVSLVRNAKGEPSAVRITADEPLKLAQDEVFLDALIEVRWASGLVRRAYTLMVGDESKVSVKAGDTLTDIASKALSDFEGASLDQALIALYRANPQAFAGGSIHRVMTGAELRLPSKAMVNSVPKQEAKELAQAADKAYRSGRSEVSLQDDVKSEVLGDRLRVGPADGPTGESKRRIEELLVQEKALADAKQRIVELEKNIGDLKHLIESQDKSVASQDTWKNYAGPVIVVIFVLLALFILLRLSKRDVKEPSQLVVPEHAAKLFASLDLNLPATPVAQNPLPADLPTPETLRVKLNLVRAYITIEDFGAARRALDEVLSVSSHVDPELTIQAKSLLAEIDQRRA